MGKISKKYIAISPLFKILVLPVVFSILSVLALIAISFVGDENAMGMIIVLLYVLIFIVGIVTPVFCFIYGTKLLTKVKQSVAFSFYNSAIIALVFSRLVNTDYRIYGFFIVFAWCELWTFITWLIFKKRTNNSNKEI